MLGSEAGAAWIRWVVDEDGLSAVCDLALEMVKIDLPALVRKKIVVVKFNAEILANRLTKRETRLGH